MADNTTETKVRFLDEDGAKALIRKLRDGLKGIDDRAVSAVTAAGFIKRSEAEEYLDKLVTARGAFIIYTGELKEDGTPAMEPSTARKDAIYLVKKDATKRYKDVFQEWIVAKKGVGENPDEYEWVLIGDTSMVFENYYTKTESEARFSRAIIAVTGNLAADVLDVMAKCSAPYRLTFGALDATGITNIPTGITEFVVDAFSTTTREEPADADYALNVVLTLQSAGRIYTGRIVNESTSRPGTAPTIVWSSVMNVPTTTSEQASARTSLDVYSKSEIDTALVSVDTSAWADEYTWNVENLDTFYDLGTIPAAVTKLTVKFPAMRTTPTPIIETGAFQFKVEEGSSMTLEVRSGSVKCPTLGLTGPYDAANVYQCTAVNNCAVIGEFVYEE